VVTMLVLVVHDAPPGAAQFAKCSSSGMVGAVCENGRNTSVGEKSSRPLPSPSIWIELWISPLTVKNGLESVTSLQLRIVTTTWGSRRSRSVNRNAVGKMLVVQLFAQASLLFALPSSHCSPGSTTPLPHTGAQSLSLVAFAPVGQQPSPLAGIVIVGN